MKLLWAILLAIEIVVAQEDPLKCQETTTPWRQRINIQRANNIQKNLDYYVTQGFKNAGRIRSYRFRVANRYSNNYPDRSQKRQLAALKRAEPETAASANCEALGFLETARLIAQSKGTPNDIYLGSILRKVNISPKLLKRVRSACPFHKPAGDKVNKKICFHYPYRRADGSCNNLDHFTWGRSFQPFRRLLKPHYANGFDTPRGHGKLPNPRRVSIAYSKNRKEKKSKKVTQMLKVWGQFLDHDLTKTPESSAGVDKKGDAIEIPCCKDGILDKNEISDECLPMRVPPEDKFLRKFGVQCLRFVRSSPASNKNFLSLREQTNELTAFVDASNVYGSNLKQQRELREFRRGRLSESRKQERACGHKFALAFLPLDTEDPDEHYRAGDKRVNEQPSLASMHTVWMRFHNILADLMHKKGKFSDEFIFQEVKKIITALIQQATYQEFLPAVLGKSAMRKFGLVTPNKPHIDKNGFNTRYDRRINPAIFNVFGAAAFRFGHTLVTSEMRGTKTFNLVHGFSNGSMLELPGFSPTEVLAGETFMQAEAVDPLLDEVLRNKLFAPEEEDFQHGNDLLSLNIMRGRDHGIPGYNFWRQFCGLPRFKNFHEMQTSGDLDQQSVNVFKRLYKHVDDVDLYIALLAEKTPEKFDEGILGPTFKCLLGRQFHNLKYGDRFWYENGPSILKEPRSRLQIKQLGLIRNSSLAYVMCRATSVKWIPTRPMESIGEFPPFNNRIRACDEGDWHEPEELLPHLIWSG